MRLIESGRRCRVRQCLRAKRSSRSNRSGARRVANSTKPAKVVFDVNHIYSRRACITALEYAKSDSLHVGSVIYFLFFLSLPRRLRGDSVIIPFPNVYTSDAYTKRIPTGDSEAAAEEAARNAEIMANDFGSTVHYTQMTASDCVHNVIKSTTTTAYVHNTHYVENVGRTYIYENRVFVRSLAALRHARENGHDYIMCYYYYYYCYNYYYLLLSMVKITTTSGPKRRCHARVVPAERRTLYGV